MLQAKFRAISGICIDPNNNLYIVDDLAYNIRKIDLTLGLVSTFVGSTTGVYGNEDGEGTQALLPGPQNLCLLGNDMYIVCFSSSKIKKVTDIMGNEDFIITQSTLYPNPTTGTFNIEVPNTTIRKICIYDMVGKMVFTENTNAVFSYVFKNSRLKQGVYHVLVVTEKGNFTKKLLVN